MSEPDLDDLEGDIGLMVDLLKLLNHTLIEAPEYTASASAALSQSVSLAIVLQHMGERMVGTMADCHQAVMDERKAAH
ncbi:MULTISPECIES: hypothetical protein [unclassified Mesorhizobium]|uniref:hypothetical protein n=1 Tax=unclassified Mesorhizobium TaxID=325217 RepID=UPI0012EC8152|nr:MULTISPECIES: hypothetical protein [unclassified Mesorhizobium]WJI76576.1 hypothetical protein NLY37_07700 [Mesorhizobium sp. C395A]